VIYSKYGSAFPWRDGGKSQEISVGISDILVEIRTDHYTTSQICLVFVDMNSRMASMCILKMWSTLEYVSSPLRINLNFGTHSLTELNPSREAANCTVSQEISSILWNPKVHYRVHKITPQVPILNQINPIHTILSYLSKIHFNIVHPPTSWSSQSSLSFLLSNQYPICIPLLLHSCYMFCPSHPSWLDNSV
jgi:hypothetical protein